MRTAALAMCAAILAAAVTFGLSHTGTHAPQVLSHATLTVQPAAPAAATGTATIIQDGATIQLRLTLSGMPSPAGYYEAWLFDPRDGTMYPVGPLTASGGTLTITGIDLRRYTGVDVSSQPVDTTGAHGTSMLSGQLHP